MTFVSNWDEDGWRVFHQIEIYEGTTRVYSKPMSLPPGYSGHVPVTMTINGANLTPAGFLWDTEYEIRVVASSEIDSQTTTKKITSPEEKIVYHLNMTIPKPGDAPNLDVTCEEGYKVGILYGYYDDYIFVYAASDSFKTIMMNCMKEFLNSMKDSLPESMRDIDNMSFNDLMWILAEGSKCKEDNFKIEAGREYAVSFMIEADKSGEVYLNGESIGEGEVFTELYDEEGLELKEPGVEVEHTFDYRGAVVETHDFSVYVSNGDGTHKVVCKDCGAVLEDHAADKCAAGSDGKCTKCGALQKGRWVQTDGKWQYRHFDGSVTRNDWENISGEWYHFDESGYRQIGWQKISNVWYYMDLTGAMVTGWFTDPADGKLYYFKPSGEMALGWYKVGGVDWYYFRSDGSLATGLYKVVSENKWYYFDDKGIMCAPNSWQNIDGIDYYFDGTGAMVIKDWRKIDGLWYYFSGTGEYVKNKFYKIDGDWYYFNEKGQMHKGWLKDGGAYYYFNPANGIMVTGSRTIDGKVYNFKITGECTNPPA